MGTSATEVQEKLGSPNRITDGTESVYGGQRRADQIPDRCVTEYWYKSVLTPEQWALCFDSSGFLVAKQHYASY